MGDIKPSNNVFRVMRLQIKGRGPWMTRVKTRTLPEDREVFSLRRDRPIAGVPMSPVRAEMEVTAWVWPGLLPARQQPAADIAHALADETRRALEQGFPVTRQRLPFGFGEQFGRVAALETRDRDPVGLA